MITFRITRVVEALKNKGVTFERGLTALEFGAVEKQYCFSFPPDLREFLSIGLPVSDDFPNWRTGKRRWGEKELSISDLIEWPAIGICFDVEHDGFWMNDWGTRPDDLQEAFRITRKIVKQAPSLIPVFSHRFLPADPALEGNPVMSVYQTDIIYYGQDLASYLANEFELPMKDQENGNREPRRIRFWSDIIDRADGIFYAGRNP